MITIPDSVTEIGDNAFEGSTNLESVTIGQSVRRIDNLTFGGCTKLKQIIPLVDEPSEFVFDRKME